MKIFKTILIVIITTVLLYGTFMITQLAIHNNGDIQRTYYDIKYIIFKTVSEEDANIQLDISLVTGTIQIRPYYPCKTISIKIDIMNLNNLVQRQLSFTFSDTEPDMIYFQTFLTNPLTEFKATVSEFKAVAKDFKIT